MNADGNMPYDICEDEQALDYIESEMAKNGVTQHLIDETRASTERKMLVDMRALAQRGEDLEQHDTQGATPVNTPNYKGKKTFNSFFLASYCRRQWVPERCRISVRSRCTDGCQRQRRLATFPRRCLLGTCKLFTYINHPVT